MKRFLQRISLSFLLIPICSFAMQQNQQKGTWDANEFPTGFYIGGNVGYVDSSWKSSATPIGGRSATYLSGPNWKNGNGGLAAGGCIGYQIRQDFGFEVGGFWFDSTSVKTTMSVAGNPFEIFLKFKGQYAVFGAFTLQVPIGPIYFNAKVGGGYQHVSITQDPPASSLTSGRFFSTGHFGPMFGAALIYPVADWSLGVRFDRFSGKNNHSKSEYITDKNVISFQVAYHF